MELNSTDSRLRLTILGYQYPDAEGEPYDANWLLVRVDAESPDGTWSASDPCLLTTEAAHLAAWLEEVQSGSPTRPALSFLEPELLFRLADGELRVYLTNFLRPPWAGEGELPCLSFPLAENDLSAAARSLRQQLAPYPPREEL